MILVNLIGAPSAGKSSGAAYIFSQLKMRGVNAELVTEFAKDKVWEESKEVFNNQAYIFGKQYFRITRCQDKVDVIVTDSPLILSAFYNQNEILGNEFNQLVQKVSNSYHSLNYLLIRDKPYNPVGRFQTEEESDALVKPLRDMLDKFGVKHSVRKGNMTDYDIIVKDILKELEKNNVVAYGSNWMSFPDYLRQMKECGTVVTEGGE